MPRMSKEWTETDREAMRLVMDAWNAMREPPSLRAVSRAIGVSAPRVMDLRDARNGRPTLDEFCDMCSLFGLDAAMTLRRAMRAAGRDAAA